MKVTKRLGLLLCGAVIIGSSMLCDCNVAMAKKVKDAKNPETIVDGKVNRLIKRPNDKFDVKVKYGIGGVVFSRYTTPIQVTVESKNNFNGEIRIIPAENYYGSPIVAVGNEISLAKGSPKTFSVAGQADRYDGGFYIQLVDEDGDIVYIEQDTYDTIWPGEKVFTAVLSDDFSGLAYFDGMEINIANGPVNSSLIELNTDTFPVNEDFLEPISVMIINQCDTSKLSEEQYNTLKKWVMNGGNLIVGLGVNADETLQCFKDDFLQGELGEVTHKELPILATKDPVDISDFTLKDGNPLGGLYDGAEIQYKQVGQGCVVVTGFDLSMEPIASAPDRSNISELLYLWLQMNQRINVEDPDIYNGAEFVDLANASNEAPKPNVVVFGALFLLYAVLAGPVIYLVLKKKNKREYIWVAIPVLSVVFTMAVWGTSLFYRIRKPMINTFSIITVSENAQMEKNLYNVVCPKVKDYSFDVSADYNDLQALNGGYRYYGGLFNNSVDLDEGEYSVLLQENPSGSHVKICNKNAFAESSFSTTRTTSNTFGQLKTDLKSDLDGFEGTITNTTEFDLHNVMIMMDQSFCMIEHLNKGETVTIDKTMLKDGRGYDVLYDVYHNNKAFGDKEADYEYDVSSAMMRSYVNQQDYGKGHIWASIGTYIPDAFSQKDAKSFGRAVLYQEIKANYGDIGNGYCSDISGLYINSTGDIGLSESDPMLYSVSADVTYSLEQYRVVTALRNEDLEVDNSDSRYRPYATVYGYNTETGDYDPLFVDSDTISGDELKKYLAGDVLILRFQQDGKNECYVPRISLQGEK